MPNSFVIICCKVNNTDYYLLLQRGYTARYEPGKWSLPGGNSNTGETPAQTAIREVKEETGMDINPDLKQIDFQHARADYFFYRLNKLTKIRLCWENIGYGWFDYEQILQVENQGWLTLSPHIPSKIAEILRLGL